ncbi:GMP/IMP nucleotidase [Thiocapsa sp.]|uniref:GMP/IMP nucleotidase n=1 Tax=Thiocapsa sp. TaxID=2024551 RepID=UPI003593D188
MIDWNRIDTVFLDMDGTLLDLHFDNHFWLEHVPERYAQAHGLTAEAAKAELLARYRDIEGTLEWYCVDHWSRELGLDIALLKQEVEHLIAIHPHVLDFLDALRQRGKRRVLVTNAHQKALALKLSRTRLGGNVERVICSHDLRVAKEAPGFWSLVQAIEPFDIERTLFIDDSTSVLQAARDFGFHWLMAVVEPDSTGPRREVADFPAIAHFGDLLPGLHAD